MQKYDAAEHEYSEALRIKPDFASVHYDWGILLRDKGDKAGAIADTKNRWPSTRRMWTRTSI